MPTAELKSGILPDITFMGLRSAIGVIFIVHGFGKFGNERFFGWMSSVGIPPEVAMLAALGEFIGGILIVIGVLSRISGAVIAAIMMGAIFYIKGAKELTGEMGYELDLILLASALVVMIAGPGRISLARMIDKIPRFVH